MGRPGKNNRFFLLTKKLCAHPTSTRVSEQLTKITGSSSCQIHMLIILFPDWAGIKGRA